MNLYTHVKRKCSRVCLCRNIGQLLAVNNLLDQLAIYYEVSFSCCRTSQLAEIYKR